MGGRRRYGQKCNDVSSALQRFAMLEADPRYKGKYYIFYCPGGGASVLKRG